MRYVSGTITTCTMKNGVWIRAHGNGRGLLNIWMNKELVSGVLDTLSLAFVSRCPAYISLFCHHHVSSLMIYSTRAYLHFSSIFSDWIGVRRWADRLGICSFIYLHDMLHHTSKLLLHALIIFSDWNGDTRKCLSRE
jgi:hypothetical protein